MHEYYQYSTSALAVAIVGLGFGAAERMMPRGRPLLVGAALAMVLESLSVYRTDYLPAQVNMNPALVVHTAPLHTVPHDEQSALHRHFRGNNGLRSSRTTRSAGR